MQKILQPTDLLLNFGVWMSSSDASCGDIEGDACTNIPEFCDFLLSEHPFRLWWQTTTPSLFDDDKVFQTIPPGHHLELVSRCKIPDANVLDRSAVLETLEPDEALRCKLYWGGAHMHADANHEFNRLFISRLPEPVQDEGEAEEKQLRKSLLQQMFA